MRDRTSSPWVGEPAQSAEFDELVVDHLGDPDGCQQVISSLMDEYVQYVAREHALCLGCPVVRSGPLVISSMLDWKARRDGRLSHWQRRDIRTFLDDHFRHEVSTDRQRMLDATSGATDLAYFMSDRGSLIGDDVHVLVAAADDVFKELTVGVSRHREPVIASPLAAELLAMGASFAQVSTSAPQRRAKRKAARAARKRNRR